MCVLVQFLFDCDKSGSIDVVLVVLVVVAVVV